MLLLGPCLRTKYFSSDQMTCFVTGPTELLKVGVAYVSLSALLLYEACMPSTVKPFQEQTKLYRLSNQALLQHLEHVLVHFWRKNLPQLSHHLEGLIPTVFV